MFEFPLIAQRGSVSLEDALSVATRMLLGKNMKKIIETYIGSQPNAVFGWKFIVLIISFATALIGPNVLAKQHTTHEIRQMSVADHFHGAAGAEESPLDRAKRLADKQESEFNHHVAGIFLCLAGIFVLMQDRLSKGWSRARYVWPLCFFFTGLFVFVFSDTEIWPWGAQSWYYALTHDPEVLQHKAFASILLFLAVVELERLRGRLTSAWNAWVLPVCALAGAVLLLFHSHGGGMHGPNAIALMNHIELQHRWYAAVGFGIVVTKALSESGTKWRGTMGKTWSVLLIVLGISLTLYSE